MTAGSETRHLKIFIIAGEASGDLLGGGLMAALAEKTAGNVTFHGVGGQAMAAQGLRSFFPMEELSVMGVAEVLPRLFNILHRIDECAHVIEFGGYDAVITIDSPDFCFRVIKKIRRKGLKTPCIHYVAPSVWAWRPGRAKKVARFLDHLLCLLPFEPPYFQREGLNATFVGHPITTGRAGQGDARRFRARFQIGEDKKILCLLPGSRRGEVSRLLDVFLETARRVRERYPDMAVVIPTLPHLQAMIAARAEGIIVTATEADKFDAFAAADVALAASGTVALELAAAGLPSVISYKMNPISAQLARLLVKLKWVSLVNILLDRAAVPELLLEKCKPDLLAPEIIRILETPEIRDGQKAAYRQSLDMVSVSGYPSPSHKAAEAVLGVLSGK